MTYQDILGYCHDTTVAELTSRCPETLDVLGNYFPEIGAHRQMTIEMLASIGEVDMEKLCEEVFETIIQHGAMEELDTDVLLELILQGYDAGHMAALPKLQRLSRKIEAVHRANPEVPKGITLAIKKLQHTLSEHIDREITYVLNRMKHDQPPRPDTPIAQMNEEHSFLKHQLIKLRQMTHNYRPPVSACRSWQRFYRELAALDFRLSEHIHVEQNVLFPRFQF